MHKNGGGVLAVGEENRKMTLKSYHEKLLNVDFVWDQNRFFGTDPIEEELKGCGTIRINFRRGKNQQVKQELT